MAWREAEAACYVGCNNGGVKMPKPAATINNGSTKLAAMKARKYCQQAMTPAAAPGDTSWRRVYYSKHADGRRGGVTCCVEGCVWWRHIRNSCRTAKRNSA
jgi:hypothetical protein